MNKVTIIGRPTKNPELRYTPSNVATCSFTLAVQRPFKNAEGSYDADFIPVVLWRKTAEYIAKYLTKGKRVAVCGRLQTRSWKDYSGTTRYITEVVSEEAYLIDYIDESVPAEIPQGFTEVESEVPS